MGLLGLDFRGDFPDDLRGRDLQGTSQQRQAANYQGVILCGDFPGDFRGDLSCQENEPSAADGRIASLGRLSAGEPDAGFFCEAILL